MAISDKAQNWGALILAVGALCTALEHNTSAIKVLIEQNDKSASQLEKRRDMLDDVRKDKTDREEKIVDNQDKIIDVLKDIKDILRDQ